MAAAVAAGLLLVGCSEEIPEALSEQAVGIDTEIGDEDAQPPEDAAPVAGEGSDDGESFPEELPDELPLRGGMELVDSSVEERDGATVVTMETVDLGEFDEAVRHFEEELEPAGWTIVESVEGEAGVQEHRFEIEGFGWSGTLQLAEEGDDNALGGTTTRLLLELTQTG